MHTTLEDQSPSPMPTTEVYAEIEWAFNHFNHALFQGQLPMCIVTLQRQKRTQGYFSAGRFTDTKNGTQVDEIALNPSYFAVQGIKNTMRTLVHQQTHCWQQHFGSPGRKRYHNGEWGDKLEEIGLMPSDTGRPGGKRTGESVSEWVIEDGLFEQAFKDLMTKQFTMRWLDRFPVSIEHLAKTLHQLPEEVQLAITEEEVVALSIEVKEQEPKKVPTPKYSCPVCRINVWGKPGMEGMLGCIPCQTTLKTQEESDGSGNVDASE